MLCGAGVGVGGCAKGVGTGRCFQPLLGEGVPLSLAALQNPAKKKKKKGEEVYVKKRGAQKKRREANRTIEAESERKKINVERNKKKHRLFRIQPKQKREK